MNKVYKPTDDSEGLPDTTTEAYKIWFDSAYAEWKQQESGGWKSPEEYANWMYTGIDCGFLTETKGTGYN